MVRFTSYDSALRSLGLPRENALRQAQFFAAYAEMLEKSRPQSREHDRGWARVAHPPQRWLGLAALASAYRRAAQHATLLDTRWATRLAVRAGQAYVAAGLPFGLFLLVGVLDDQILRDSSASSWLLTPFATPAASPALQDPVQQMYLLMAAASLPWLRDPLADTLEGAVQRLTAHDLQPIGPQRVPLGEYLDLAVIMLYDEQGTVMQASTEVHDIAGRLAAMYRAQAASLRSARRNQYLWRHGVAPVNVVDLEHLAMYGLAMRHRPWAAELSEAIAGELDRDEALAELPVWAAESIDSKLPEISLALVEDMSGPRYAGDAAAFTDESTWLLAGSPRFPDESPRRCRGDGPPAGSMPTEPTLAFGDEPDADRPYYQEP